MILSPNMNLDGILIFIAVIMIGPPIIFTIIGVLFHKRNKKAAKVFYILAVVYLLISLGICGTILTGA